MKKTLMGTLGNVILLWMGVMCCSAVAANSVFVNDGLGVLAIPFGVVGGLCLGIYATNMEES